MAVYRIDVPCGDPRPVLDWISAYVPPAEVVRTSYHSWSLTVVFKRAEDAAAFQERWRPGEGDHVAPFGSVDVRRPSGRDPRDLECPRAIGLPRVSGLKLTATDRKLLGEILTLPRPVDVSSCLEATDRLQSYLPLEAYLEAAVVVARQGGAGGPAALSRAIAEALEDSMLEQAGIARRFLLDDPAEIARFAAVHLRTEWMLGRCQDLPGTWTSVLHALAIGDEVLLERLATVTRFPRSSEDAHPFPAYYPWLDDAVLGILSGDLARARDRAQQLRARRLLGGDSAIIACLEGILTGSADRVAEGLRARASAVRKLRAIAPHFKLVDLCVHGLFELCRRPGPALAAQWDTAAGLPWDAAFHAWRRRGHDPLRGVDWSGVPEGFRAQLLERPIADRVT